jgi:hypothetical protein
MTTRWVRIRAELAEILPGIVVLYLAAEERPKCW